LQRHITGVDRATFLGSEVIHDAVCKCIEAVGEAAGKLDDLDPELDRTVPGLNLKFARRMRDRMTGTVWDTATTSMPQTVEAARSLMRKYDGDGVGGGASGGPPI
jgi:uncharacterized protein with HEPN domain